MRPRLTSEAKAANKLTDTMEARRGYHGSGEGVLAILISRTTL